MPGGQAEDRTPIYISRCRGTHDGKKVLVPGKLQSGRSWYPFDGREKQCQDYDVLVCAEENTVGFEVSNRRGGFYSNASKTNFTCQHNHR